MAELFGQFKNGAKPIYNAGIEAVAEFREGSSVKKRAPKIRLMINPFFPPFLPIEFISEDFGGLIQSATWEKSRSQAGGTFTITMAADDKAFTSKLTGWPLNAIWRSMGASLRDLFKPMTLAQLWLDGYHVMTGYLRVFRKQTSVSSKTYTAQFDELGMLYQQSILRYDVILYGEEIFMKNNPGKALSLGGQLKGNFPVSYGLNAFVNAFLASSLNYGLKGFPTPYLSGSDLLPLAFRMIVQPAPIGGISNTSLWTTLETDFSIFNHAGAAFWDFMKFICPDPFIELFTESGGRTICTGKAIGSATSGVRSIAQIAGGASAVLPIPGINITPMLPGFNYLIMRTMPYDNPLIGISAWYPLLYAYTLGVFDLLLAGDFIIITDEDVIEKDLGVSDIQQDTIFDVNFNGKNASAGTATGSLNRPSISSGPTLPIFPGGIRTYGPRLKETAIDITAMQIAGIVTQSGQRFNRKFRPGSNVKSLSTLLNVWFRNAAKFNEGTITTRNIPYARPGMVLLYLPTYNTGKVDDPRDIGTYYIDNLSSEYNLGKKGNTTTFSVIRGTPIPNTMANLVTMLMDWEILPTGFNLTDIEI